MTKTRIQSAETAPDSSPTDGPLSKSPSRWRVTFAALKYPNYRLWFWGQMVSLFGTWMQTTAQGFLVYELTHSPKYLGYVGFASGIPTWFLTLYGGVVADRLPRRTLIIVTQSCMMTLALILAALTFIHAVQAWHILLLACFLGIANSFDAPARQAFVGEMVGRKEMTNAIALNSTMFQSATIVGPAAAGVAYAMFGPGWCFTINGVSFIAVIMALRAMKLESGPRTAGTASALAEVKEGLRYVVAQPVIRILIGMVAATSMFALSIVTLIPAWSVNILGGGASTNGFLLSARGAGSLAGALIIASLGSRIARGRLLTIGSIVFPLLLFAFAFARFLPLSLMLLAGVGVGTILVNNLANAMVQTATPDRLRGRVMGAYTWIFFGFMPLGALWSGTVAEHLSEPAAIVINALLALGVAVAIWFAFPRIREQ
jgi:MFS family permease